MIVWELGVIGMNIMVTMATDCGGQEWPQEMDRQESGIALEYTFHVTWPRPGSQEQGRWGHLYQAPQTFSVLFLFLTLSSIL